MTRAECIETVEDDQLSVVVGFSCDQIDVGRRSSYP